MNAFATISHDDKDLSLLDGQVLATLLSLDGGRGDFLKELIDLLAAGAPPVIAQLIAHLEAGRSKESVRTAHKLKGMCGNLGAIRLEHCLERVEHRFDLMPAAEREAFPQLLQKLFDETMQELAAHWSRPTSCAG